MEGKKKIGENEPTGFTFHGRRKEILQGGFRRRGNPPLKSRKDPISDPEGKKKIWKRG